MTRLISGGKHRRNKIQSNFLAHWVRGYPRARWHADIKDNAKPASNKVPDFSLFLDS